VGKHRVLVHQVQLTEGKPSAARRAHATHPETGAAKVASGDLARAGQPEAARGVERFPRRGVLERRAGGLRGFTAPAWRISAGR